jgi:hypothetical protein
MANEFVARKGIISIGIISGSGDLNIANNGIIGGNLTVGGTLTAQEFRAELVSSSIIYESGSTKFGDTLDDTHQRTGSFFISGTAFTVTSSNFNLLGAFNQNGTSTISGQLNVDNIRIDDNTISSQNSNGNIELTPNGTGDVYLNADTVRIGDLNTASILTTNGTGNLTLSTNNGTNSGTFVINQGINGNIALTPNGTGTINLAANTNVTGTLNATTALTSSLLTIDNIRIDGNTISSINTNGNITLDASGSGIVDVKDGLTVTGSLIVSSSLSVGTTSTVNRFTFDGGNIGSPTFLSGFAGAGFRLQSGSNEPVGGSASGSGWKLEIDHLSVRGTMKIYELLINQIRATNGSLWVSSVGKVETVIRSGSSSTFYLFFDTGSNSGSSTNIGHGFFPGDLIRAQRFIWGGQAGGTGSRAEVYRSDLEVVTVSGSIITASLRAGATAPSGGFEFVRIGSTSNVNRRGAVYLTADDNDAPFIDVIDKVDSFAAFESTAKNKVRMGKLNGITSPTFGPLTGSGGTELYGFWASGSAYLEGGINAAFGKIANLTITGSSIYTGTGTYSNTNTPFFLSSSGQLSLKDRFIWDGNNLFISGALTASAGNIANFFIDANNLWAGSSSISGNTTNIIINSSNPKIALGPTASLITVAGTQAGVILSGSGDFKAFGTGNNFIRKLGTSLEIRSENIALTGSNIEITANGTSSKIRLGNVTSANDTATTTSGSYIDNLGNALFQRNTNNYLQISGSQVVIRSENFVLSGSTFRLNSAAGGTFALGATLPTSHTSGTGIFLSGSGQVLIGSATGNRIQFDGSNLILSSSTFLLGNASNFVSGSDGNIRISGSNVQIQTPSFYLGGATQFISGAGGTIEISSSNFHLKNGNITASNGIFSGQITATTGSFTGNVNVGTDTYVIIGPNATAGNPGAGVNVPTSSINPSFAAVTLTESGGSYIIPASSSIQTNFTGSLISQSSGKRIIASGSIDIEINTIFSQIRTVDGKVVVSLYRDSTQVSSVQIPFSYVTSSFGTRTITGDGPYELFHTILDNNTYNFSIRSQVIVDDVTPGTSPVSQNVSFGTINGSFLLTPPPNLAIRNSGIFVNYSDREQSLLDIALAGGSGGSTSTGGGGGGGTVTSITAGAGLLGGTIVDIGTISLDTGSAHFVSGARKTISVTDTTGASGIDLTYNNGTGVLSGTLVNSSLTVGSTAISLGGTATTIAGLTSLTSTNITGSTISASGTVTANTFSGGSFSGTTITASGNAKLGDATVDAHTVTGSFGISGSLNVNGQSTFTAVTATGNVKLGDATTDSHTVTGSLGISGSFNVLQSSYGVQVSSSITTGTNAVVASIATGSFNGVYFDYTIGIASTGRRIGTVMTTWLPGGTNVEYTDFSTLDMGLTGGVSMAADIATGNIRLRANNTSGQTVEVRTITRAI